MMPPVPAAAAAAASTTPSIDTDRLSQLVRGPPPTVASAPRRCPPQPAPDDLYANLVIPPPPPQSQQNDSEIEEFLAKIVACNGVVRPPDTTKLVAAVNGLNVGAGTRYFGRQLSDPVPSGSAQMPYCRSVNETQRRSELASHYRCSASTMNSVGSGQSTVSGSTTAQASSASLNTDGRLGVHRQIGKSGSAEGGRNNITNGIWCSGLSVSISEEPRRCLVSRSSTVAVTPTEADGRKGERRSSEGGVPTLRGRDSGCGGGSLPRSTTSRRRPPPPPPRTSSVQNSPAMMCRSEQLTRRGLPRLTAGRDRRTPLPSPPAAAPRVPSPALQAALIRPGALRSSFTAAAATGDAAAAASPPSPDWSFQRSHSLTESASAGRTTPTGGRPSLLAAIGSRLRSYWSPSLRGPALRNRPSTATGNRESGPSAESRRPPQIDALLRPGELDSDDTYLSFDVDLTSHQLRTSPTTSSFSSFTGD